MKRYFSLILAIAATVSAQIVPSTGNVRGPTSATDNAVARYDGTTGKLIQNSGATIDDSGNLTVSGTGNSSVAGTLLVATTTNSSNGKLQLATHTTSAGGIGFGTDVSLYRQDENTLVVQPTGSSKKVLFYGDSTVSGLFNSLSSYEAIYFDPSAHSIKLATNGFTALTLSSTQAVRLNAYGAGALTTDSSGNVTATSDERAKNIIGTFTKGLAEVVKLTPKTYTWKPETGLNPTDEVVSLTAQDLISAGLPEAVSTYRTVADLNDDGTPKLDADGKPLTKRIDATYTVSDRAVIAALVNAVKELKAEVDALKAARN